MKKYIKRLIVATHSIRVESGMTMPQLVHSQSKGNDYEFYEASLYLPTLTISLNTKDGKWEDRRIRATERSFKRLMLCFRKVLEWFYDENKKDLFVYDVNNNLVFNHAYKELNEVYFDAFDSNRFMKIIPAAIQTEGNKFVEGLSIYINQLDTIVGVTRIQFEDIVSVLSDFSFAQEATVLMLAYQLAEKSGSIIDRKFFVEHSETEKALRAVPISNRPINPFGI